MIFTMIYIMDNPHTVTMGIELTEIVPFQPQNVAGVVPKLMAPLTEAKFSAMFAEAVSLLEWLATASWLMADDGE